jgi:serine/threonine protein kinase
MSQGELQIVNENPLNFYSIKKTICAGRNSVYQALDTRSNRNVVLKTFPMRARINEGYLREKLHLARLDHPFIIQLYEAGDLATSTVLKIEEEVSYLALEYASYGDVLEVISKNGHFSEILARSMFHQLINAISYLHSENIAHLDLKVENLLLGEDLNIKLIDFDLSQVLGSSSFESKGTPGFRCPELKNGSCTDFKAADVYSCAVILFILLSGFPPYREVSRGSRGDADFDAYYKALRNNTEKFWDAHSRHKNNPEFFSKEFKDLFVKMIAEKPENRPTIEEIMTSEWFQGPVLEGEEYKEQMRKYLGMN